MRKMKYCSFPFAVASALLFSGCEGITLEENPDNGTVPIDEVVPYILPSIGNDVSTAEYLYPSNTLDGYAQTALYRYSYSLDQDGVVDSNIPTETYQVYDYIDALQNGYPSITITDNDSVVAEDSLETSYIRTKDNITHPSNIAINDAFSDYYLGDIETVCVVRNIVDGTHDLSSVVDDEVYRYFTSFLNTEDENISVYSDTMHVYCGSSDGTMSDHYYAKGIGEVLRINSVYNTTAKTYTLLDQNSIQNLSY